MADVALVSAIKVDKHSRAQQAYGHALTQAAAEHQYQQPEADGEEQG